MTPSRAGWLIAWVLIILGIFLLLAVVARAAPEWSSYRAVAQAAITCTLSRAPKDDAGHVIGPFVNLATIPAQGADRVMDEPLDPGYQYLMDCHFTVTDGIIYETTAYLPITLRPRRR